MYLEAVSRRLEEGENVTDLCIDVEVVSVPLHHPRLVPEAVDSLPKKLSTLETIREILEFKVGILGIMLRYILVRWWMRQWGRIDGHQFARVRELWSYVPRDAASLWQIVLVLDMLSNDLQRSLVSWDLGRISMRGEEISLLHSPGGIGPPSCKMKMVLLDELVVKEKHQQLALKARMRTVSKRYEMGKKACYVIKKL